MQQRVVVTGLGLITPLGIGWENFWRSCLDGVSGVGPITLFDATGMATRIAAEVKGFAPEDYLPRKELRKMDRFVHLGASAARLALEDGCFEITPQRAEETGVIIGAGIGGMSTIEAQHTVLMQRGHEKVSPFFVPMLIANMVSGMVGILHGLKGPNLSVVTACATGAHCIGQAVDMIRAGRARWMLAGGAEAVVTPLSLAGFASMHALSTRNDEPARASRPFDRDRDGFVMGEGAAVLLLESEESARERGAKIYGEIAGYGLSADAHHITSPDPSGAGAVRAMRMALRDAGLSPADIDYVNAHATSTPVGDKTESAAVQCLLGERALQVPVSSTKSMTGHMLGAAGAIETAVCILATRDDVVPPTINLENPDPDCVLDYVPNQARSLRVDVAINNSYGFGGQNAVILARKYVH